MPLHPQDLILAEYKRYQESQRVAELAAAPLAAAVPPRSPAFSLDVTLTLPEVAGGGGGHRVLPLVVHEGDSAEAAAHAFLARYAALLPAQPLGAGDTGRSLLPQLVAAVDAEWRRRGVQVLPSSGPPARGAAESLGDAAAAPAPPAADALSPTAAAAAPVAAAAPGADASEEGVVAVVDAGAAAAAAVVAFSVPLVVDGLQRPLSVLVGQNVRAARQRARRPCTPAVVFSSRGSRRALALLGIS
jgi:hypothetical protein